MSDRDAGGEVAERIVGCATKLFAEKGYAGTPVREIVEAAGVTKPALYYWFGNKDGLCTAIVKKAFDELDRRLDGLDPARDGRDRLADFVAAHFTYAASRPHLSRFMYYLNWAPELEDVVDVEPYNRRWMERVGTLAAHLCDGGHVRGADTETATLAIAAMINMWLMRHIKEGLPLGPKATAQVAAFLCGR
jgi:AcrR family transcriptional regulator